MSAIDLTKIKVDVLTDNEDCSNFYCGNESIDEFIHDEARDYQNKWLGVSYIFHYDDVIVGFVTLSMADLKAEKLNATERLLFPTENIPALQISQLAVCEESAGKGIGTFLCEWCLAKALKLSKTVGCRFLILNAKQKAIGFYQKNGFALVPKQTRRQPVMYLDIIKVAHAV
jgi:GNAT superfamily N-acetyltransferase